MMKIPAHAKYQIIYDTMQKSDNLLNVTAMCEIAGYPVRDITTISQQKTSEWQGRNRTGRIFF